ncbi:MULTISPECIES: substrate-binding domain-containing protein [Actinoplanes]|uniref:sugar ABC transporter substrate-binding protein n=1 Tax=Actinoplanes TaxID=1865 RepID=UPI0005F2E833|nr:MULTISPECIES: substrate-binding domain-containing protein [Actinoplanes]GLY00398.1 sugar ABC transporter substrate-binding protein [Actinoplanes sp. NBRC 101535]
MRKSLISLAAIGLLATATMTACDSGSDPSDNGGSTTTGSSGGGTGGTNGIGVVLPDTTTDRWATADAKYLKSAFDAKKIPSRIVNAEGDREQFKRLAGELLDSGVKVLIIANLDSASGKAVIDDAKAHNVPVIDYDRLTLNGGADYYVSFDNELVGKLQAQHLKTCLGKKNVENPLVAELNGSPTDNNATLFKTGYDSVLQPLYDSATFTKGPDQWVPDWKEDEAREIFSQMLGQYPNIDGVLSANDGIANAIIEVLKAKKLNGKVPVTGQDASLDALQHILMGDQCMTVFKETKLEADAAAELAIGLYNDVKPQIAGKLKDPESGAYVPFRQVEPKAITIDNIGDVVASGAVDVAELCDGSYAGKCRKAKLID